MEANGPQLPQGAQGPTPDTPPLAPAGSDQRLDRLDNRVDAVAKDMDRFKGMWEALKAVVIIIAWCLVTALLAIDVGLRLD